MVFDAGDLGRLIERYGADHVLLGTDYPYDMGEDDPVGLVMAVPGLGDDERRAVLGGNAARLLRLGGARGGDVQPPASVTVADGS
jgi:aminocarboxymuconate-semialdehyde decarboxylase